MVNKADIFCLTKTVQQVANGPFRTYQGLKPLGFVLSTFEAYCVFPNGRTAFRAASRRVVSPQYKEKKNARNAAGSRYEG